MVEPRLSAEELTALVLRVFQPRASDRALAIIADLPDEALADNVEWKRRRELAAEWASALASTRATHGLEVSLYWYRNARSNNADLPDSAWRHTGGEVPATADQLSGGAGQAESFSELFGRHSLVLAPTELSATAPLKMMSRQLGFRAATMPGFGPSMIPALKLDYTEVNRRVQILKRLLDDANRAELSFEVDGTEAFELTLDLRHRKAHASGGLFPEPGTAGNLPSGEAYIVPYEGERDDDPSATAGLLPVQIGDEVVKYQIEHNRAQAVISVGPESSREAERLASEPARGNLAELGLGVLSDFGIVPIGQVLLDEKLGLHIAFGRSEHFGGQVGPAQFSSPEAVIHQDHVYIDAIQPRVRVARAWLGLADGRQVELVRSGAYVVAFD